MLVWRFVISEVNSCAGVELRNCSLGNRRGVLHWNLQRKWSTWVQSSSYCRTIVCLWSWNCCQNRYSWRAEVQMSECAHMWMLNSDTLQEFLQPGVWIPVQDGALQACQSSDFLLGFVVNQMEIQIGSLAQAHSWAHAMSLSSKLSKQTPLLLLTVS